MPTLRAASAPKTSAMPVPKARPSRTPIHGFQPRLRPFVSVVVALPSAKPATP